MSRKLCCRGIDSNRAANASVMEVHIKLRYFTGFLHAEKTALAAIHRSLLTVYVGLGMVNGIFLQTTPVTFSWNGAVIATIKAGIVSSGAGVCGLFLWLMEMDKH